MKTIEETYQKLDQRDHILLRPGMYIGETTLTKESIYILNENKMEQQLIEYSPGFLKIFDEILSNAIDHSVRDPTVNTIKVSIQKDSITVFNNGKGIPVVLHKEHGVYIPELVFGNLLAGSNYDDTQKRTVAGTNGLGATLANIFSKEFTIETIDAENQKKFIQTFTNNMSSKTAPKITKNSGKSYTKITFTPDYPKFCMTGLNVETLQLLKRRTFDCIATTDKRVKVYFNNEPLQGKGMSDYSKYFSEDSICETVDTWDFAVIPSDTFKQISFVNGNLTSIGGKHVDYIVNQITSKLKILIEKKKKITELKTSVIKDRLFLILKSVVVNPHFNSQTKETLTTGAKDFGVSITVPDKFINKLFNSSITEDILSIFKQKELSSLSKTDGKKKSKISIPNLEDAIHAGTSKSAGCTLILTEGLSAMTFAMWGRSVHPDGMKKYGVYALKGKILGIRNASAAQIAGNVEINAIKQIIGLKQNEIYKDTKGLRYSKVILLTDSDVDGSHISGLFMSFIHAFWPSLIRLNPSFIQTIKTPIVKATKGKETLEFFTEGDYRKWQQDTSCKGYSIKYFKGLGTSTKNDAKDIFKRIEELRVDYTYKDKECDKSILLAFDKDTKSVCSDARKEWLRKYNKDSYIQLTQKEVSYTDFIHKELIHFSIYDNVRSIPSICDGLKPSQRKILYYMIKKGIDKPIKVGQLSGYVSAETGYHHGETSLQQAIIGMAQDFIGTNNINLLYPDGNFGSRLSPNDAASPRYIFTRLQEITKKIFDKRDLALLVYLEDDGLSIEPEWFIPIIPMILVNGCSGIGTGFSTSIPQYNPKDVITNLKRLIKKEPTVKMEPWFKNFKGKVSSLGNGNYQTEGTLNNGIITEIPVGTFLSPYKEYLESQPGVSSVKNLTRDENTDIQIHITHEPTVNLKLTKKFSTTNMYLFNRLGVITKYDSPEEILKEFYIVRLGYYSQRREYLIKMFKAQLKFLMARKRFVEEYTSGILNINRKSVKEINEILTKSEFPLKEGSYGYLIDMPFSSITTEKIKELEKACETKQKELDFYISNAPENLWLIDLETL